MEKSINQREIDGLETFMFHETVNKDEYKFFNYLN